MDKKSNNSFLFNEGEGKCGYGTIEARFQALIDKHHLKPTEWYQALGLDRSYASKIRRGIIIPPEWLRIKIATYFEADTSTIWKVEDLTRDKIKEEKESDKKEN